MKRAKGFTLIELIIVVIILILLIGVVVSYSNVSDEVENTPVVTVDKNHNNHGYRQICLDGYIYWEKNNRIDSPFAAKLNADGTPKQCVKPEQVRSFYDDEG